MCPAYAVDYLSEGVSTGKTCSHPKVHGEKLGERCGWCVRRSEQIVRWKTILYRERQRARLMREKLFEMAANSPVRFEKPVFPIRRVECVACGGLKWMPGTTEIGGGTLRWECGAVPTCWRCLGRKRTGKTKAERVAQVLGEFGVCPECEGKGKRPCTVTVMVT